MHSTADETRGKLAVTHFRVLRRTGKLSALEVTLETGRKNQIRAHLSEMGHPIVGDRAYGSSLNPLRRLGLHAFQLGFKHPVSGDSLVFRTDPPPEFRKYLPDKANNIGIGIVIVIENRFCKLDKSRSRLRYRYDSDTDFMGYND